MLLDWLGTGDMPAPEDAEADDDDGAASGENTDKGWGLVLELTADSKLSLSLTRGDVEDCLLGPTLDADMPLSRLVFSFFFLEGAAALGVEAVAVPPSSMTAAEVDFSGGDSQGSTSATASPASSMAWK